MYYVLKANYFGEEVEWRSNSSDRLLRVVRSVPLRHEIVEFEYGILIAMRLAPAFDSEHFTGFQRFGVELVSDENYATVEYLDREEEITEVIAVCIDESNRTSSSSDFVREEGAIYLSERAAAWVARLASSSATLTPDPAEAQPALESVLAHAAEVARKLMERNGRGVRNR